MTQIIKTKFTVIIDDNFHFTEENFSPGGEFGTYEEAVAECKKIVDDCLSHLKPQLMRQVDGPLSPESLFDYYKAFGDDPFVNKVPDSNKRFSAWEYAEERCKVLCMTVL